MRVGNDKNINEAPWFSILLLLYRFKFNENKLESLDKVEESLIAPFKPMLVSWRSKSRSIRFF